MNFAALAKGAAILGSGGGGSTLVQERICRHLIREPLRLLTIDNLKDDDLVVPIAFMGAPLVAQEKIPTGLEAAALLEMIRAEYGQNIVLMPAEIGGGNAFTPLWIAALHQLPVLDADSIGRAFPKLHMSTLHLAGVDPLPAFFANSDGKTAILRTGNVEELGRKICVDMGSRALVALYLMDGKTAKQSVVAGSISRAMALGESKCDSPLSSGVIEAIDYRVEGGFLKGTLTLRRKDQSPLILRFVNEFLVVEERGIPIAQSPDIITLIETYSRKVVSTSEAKWGLSVEILVLPSPEIWKTEAGLKLVGVDQHDF
jgi:DUF917 family protein